MTILTGRGCGAEEIFLHPTGPLFTNRDLDEPAYFISRLASSSLSLKTAFEGSQGFAFGDLVGIEVSGEVSFNRIRRA